VIVVFDLKKYYNEHNTYLTGDYKVDIIK
jgi:hypothetical protein